MVNYLVKYHARTTRPSAVCMSFNADDTNSLVLEGFRQVQKQDYDKAISLMKETVQVIIKETEDIP